TRARCASPARWSRCASAGAPGRSTGPCSPSWAWATSSRSDGRWAMRSGVLTVFRKELLEVSRDRRTLFFMIAMPLLLIPLIIQITTDFISDAEKEAASATLDYAIFGDEQLPELAQAFTRTPGF